MSLSSNTPVLNALQLYHFRHNGTISVLPQLFLFLLPTKGHKQTWPPLFPGLQDFLVFWLWLFLWPPHFLASLKISDFVPSHWYLSSLFPICIIHYQRGNAPLIFLLRLMCFKSIISIWFRILSLKPDSTGMKWLLSSDSLDKLHWGILSLPLLDDIKPAGSVFLHIFLPSWTSGSDSVAHDCSQNTARTTALSTIHYLPHGYQNAFVYQVLAYCSVLHKLTTSLYPALLYKLSEYLVFVFKDKIITLFYILLIIPTVLCKALLDSYMVKRAN